MTLSDFTDTIHVKMFVKNEFLEDIRGKIKAGAFEMCIRDSTTALTIL